MCVCVCVHTCVYARASVCVRLCAYVLEYIYHTADTVIWFYFALKIFRTLLFRIVLISYAPHIVYETRVKILLLKNIRTFNFRMDGSVRN